MDVRSTVSFQGKPRLKNKLAHMSPHFEPLEIMAIVLGDWYDHSLVEDDSPRQHMAISGAGAVPTHAEIRTRTILGIKRSPYHVTWLTLSKGQISW